MKRIPLLLAIAMLAAPALAQPLTTAFTYQGELQAAGQPAQGPHDFQFLLFDAAAGGGQVGPTLCVQSLQISGGRFTVELDFGPQFSGQPRYLEVWTRTSSGLGCSNTAGFVSLSPRTPLTAAPGSLYSLAAGAAVTAGQLNGQPASFYTNAANLSSGTLPDARLGANVVRTDVAQTFTSAPGFAAPPLFLAAPGTSPFFVNSITRVDNLNADLLDGLDSAAFARLGEPNSFTAAQQVQSSTFAALALSGSSALGTLVSLTGSATGVRKWDLVTSGDGHAEGGGKLLVRDAGVSGSRVAIDSSGNVGIGTASPQARLDVHGAVRAGGGVLFADGSVQHRAYQTSPPVISGLPAGSTFSVQLGGSAVTFTGEYALERPMTIIGGQYAYAGPLVGSEITVRRPRTGNQDWLNWTTSQQLVPFSMTLSAPPTTMTWSSNVSVATVRLIAVGGVLMEEADLRPVQIPLALQVQSLSPASPPSGDLPDVSCELDSVPVSGAVAFGSVRGLDPVTTGTRPGPVVWLRANPLTDKVLREYFIDHTPSVYPAARVIAGGSLYWSSGSSALSNSRFRLADDGLPIVEYKLLLNFQ
jgi:hypothetical protein